MKTVTVAQLIKASEKNGFPWSGHNSKSSPLTPQHHLVSCVVGQGVENLGGTKFPYFLDGRNPQSILSRIYEYNDHYAPSYEHALRFMKDVLAPYRRKKVRI